MSAPTLTDKQLIEVFIVRLERATQDCRERIEELRE